MKQKLIQFLRSWLARLEQNPDLVLETDEKKKSKTFFILEAGHGATHPKTGEYMTPASHGKRYTFNNGFEIREGDVNRGMLAECEKQLIKLGYDYTIISHEYENRSLQELASRANQAAKLARQNGQDPVLISLHSNAFGVSAEGEGEDPRGWSVWTSRGQTDADPIAQKWYKLQMEEFGKEITYRAEYSDSDADWEADFYILQYTAMPAVLVENLFFTNYEDAQKLINPKYQKRCGQVFGRLAEWLETR